MEPIHDTAEVVKKVGLSYVIGPGVKHTSIVLLKKYSNKMTPFIFYYYPYTSAKSEMLLSVDRN